MQVVNDFDLYRIFFYVTEAGTMSRAAGIIGMTPSSITKNIHILEARLNAQLFVRSLRGVILTAEGKALYERIKPAVSLIQSGERTIQSMRSLDSGQLTIALTGNAIPNALSCEWLTQYQGQYPKIKVRVLSCVLSAVSELLNSGYADLALCSIPVNGDYSKILDSHQNVTLEPLFKIRDAAIVGYKNRQLATSPVTLAELNSLPLIFTSDHDSNSYLYYTNIYREHGLPFSPSIELPIVGMQINSVRLGLGYSLIPETSLKMPLMDKEVFTVNVSNMEMSSQLFSVATPAGIPLSRAATAFIEILRRP